MGIIKRVTDPTDWVSSLVTVMKPNRKIKNHIHTHELPILRSNDWVSIRFNNN